MKPTAAAVLALLLPLAACSPDGGGDAAPPAAEPTRLESSELGIAVVVPAGSSFAAADAAGGELRLASPGETTADGTVLGPATVVYAAEPPQEAGVNLVAAVNERSVEIEARPGGEFLGQIGLGSQLGNAMNTRGRFVGEDGREVEEVRIFAVHPHGDRLLHMTMRYAPVDGQARARADQAMEAFGWIEPLAAPPAAAETGAAAAP